jgi:hypothetical protein
MAKKSKPTKDQGTVIRMLPDDLAVVSQLGTKLNLPGMKVPEIVRLALRRYAESQGVRV